MCHSQGRILFYTAGSRNESGRCGYAHKRKLDQRKTYVFLIEKYIEDVRQDEKRVPYLLESIMRPTDPVKAELRQKLFKIDQFDPRIPKIRVCTFQMSGKIPDSANVAFEVVILTDPTPKIKKKDSQMPKNQEKGFPNAKKRFLPKS